jgi:hypothetical protein
LPTIVTKQSRVAILFGNLFDLSAEVNRNEEPGARRGKDVDEINELKRSGMSIQATSELTGYDRKTIRKYLLKTERPAYPARPASASNRNRSSRI